MSIGDTGHSSNTPRGICVRAMRLLGRSLLFATILLTLSCGLAGAATLNVPSQYATIQAAIDAAVDGDTVLVAPGTYAGPGNVDLSLRKPISLESSNGAQTTIIDCQGSAGTPHRAFICSNISYIVSPLIQGFTVKNGYSSHGGAVNIAAGSPIIKDCIFSHNTSPDSGGAIYVEFGAALFNPIPILWYVTISDCTFADNFADFQGGAIYARYNGVSVVSADNRDYLDTILFKSSIESCSFSNNKTRGTGGAIEYDNLSFFEDLDPSPDATRVDCDISRCKFFNNAAGDQTLYYGYGGAIQCYDPYGNVDGLRMTGSNDVFVGNTAQYDGGAIGFSGFDRRAPFVQFTNCSFTGNNASGISSPLTGLPAPSPGSQPGTFSANNGNGSLLNCIFWGDLSPVELSSLEPNPDSNFNVLGCDIQGGGPAGGGNIDIDPLYLGAADLRVAYNSPVIGLSQPGYPPADIDGNLRDAHPDLGAYEYVVSVTATPIAATAGAVFSGQVATFTDTNGGATPAAAFTGAIDWGDGSTSAATIGASGSGYTATGTHTYTQSGNHTVTVTITANTNPPEVTGSGASTATVAPGAVSQLAIVFSGAVTAGTPASFMVIAEDANGNTVPGYVGTVHFTTSDVRAMPPANTVVHGSATLSVTFKMAGVQSLTATDVSVPSIHGSATTTVNPGPATNFRFGMRSTTATGRVPFAFTVGAVDANGNSVPSYSGIVHFTSSDPLAVLPADSPLTGSPNFTAIFKTPGTQSITAISASGPAIATFSPAITVVTGPVAGFAATIPSTTVAGVGQPLTITPQDQYGNPVASYSGTVHIACTDPHAADVDGGGYVVLPVDVALTGPRTVSVALYTVGTHSFTVTSTATPSLTGTSNAITVTPAAAAAFRFNIRSSSAVGQPLQFSLQAIDAFGNTTPAYNGTVHFTSSDPSAALPPNSTLVGGVGGPYTATLNTAGTKTIVATDTGNALVTSTAAVIVYGPAVRFQVVAPASATTGVPVSLHVGALDSNSNTAQGYTGTVLFTSTDGQASLPVSVTLNHGVGDFPATLKTVGRHTVTATDSVSSSITGRSGNISVSANTASALTVTIPSSASTSRATSGTVTARDAYGNAATSYVGTVHFTSSDPLATLPANTSLVNGLVTFPVKFGTVGSQTVSVTDGTLTATSNTATVTLR